MAKKILCSTGTIVGRANGFDYTLISRYGSEICADGLELMMLKAYYENLTSSQGFPHFEKRFGH